MKSFLSVITPMRAITKFLLAFPRNQHHQSCELISTIKTSSFSSSSSIVSTRNTARRSKISYLHQPVRPGTSFSTNRIFGRRSTTARLFSSVDHKQPNDDDDDDENTHHRNRNDNDNDSNTTRHNWLVVGDGDLSYSSTIAEELANKDIQLFATVLEEENDHHRIYERSKKNKEDILSHSSHHPNNKNQERDTSSSSQHQVLFGVDATRLEEYDFSTATTKSTDATTCLTTKTDDNTDNSNINNDIKFQTIEFNFPHWSGKTNAKRNRQLLDEFLRSASKVLNNQNEKEEEDDDDDVDVDSGNVSEIIISLCEGQGGFPASNGMYSQYSCHNL